ncbi:hypothetical protein Hdeb2414_s0105g00795691 [Helianthus debilis subsp. tardiflorus]
MKTGERERNGGAWWCVVACGGCYQGGERETRRRERAAVAVDPHGGSDRGGGRIDGDGGELRQVSEAPVLVQMRVRKSTTVNRRFGSMFRFGQQWLSLVLCGSDLGVTARSVHMFKRMGSCQHECSSGRLGRTESTRLTQSTRSTSFSFSTRRVWNIVECTLASLVLETTSRSRKLASFALEYSGYSSKTRHGWNRRTMKSRVLSGVHFLKDLAYLLPLCNEDTSPVTPTL